MCGYHCPCFWQLCIQNRHFALQTRHTDVGHQKLSQKIQALKTTDANCTKQQVPNIKNGFWPLRAAIYHGETLQQNHEERCTGEYHIPQVGLTWNRKHATRACRSVVYICMSQVWVRTTRFQGSSALHTLAQPQCIDRLAALRGGCPARLTICKVGCKWRSMAQLHLYCIKLQQRQSLHTTVAPCKKDASKRPTQVAETDHRFTRSF